MKFNNNKIKINNKINKFNNNQNKKVIIINKNNNMIKKKFRKFKMKKFNKLPKRIVNQIKNKKK